MKRNGTIISDILSDNPTAEDMEYKDPILEAAGGAVGGAAIPIIGPSLLTGDLFLDLLIFAPFSTSDKVNKAITLTIVGSMVAGAAVGATVGYTSAKRHNALLDKIEDQRHNPHSDITNDPRYDGVMSAIPTHQKQ